MPYFHHILLHFPIALSVLAGTFVVLSWIRPNGPWAGAARLVAYCAALGAFAAVVTGLLSASHVIEAGMDPREVARHRNVALGGGAMLLVAAGAACLAHRRKSLRVTKIAAGLTLAAAVVVGVAGHSGGAMLHPGLAPWSGEKHSHKPMDMQGARSSHAHDHDHANAGHPADGMDVPRGSAS